MNKKDFYEYTTKKISDLIPYINNSRTHSDAQVRQIAASINEFGFTTPILIDEQGGVIAGHGRIMAAEKLGNFDELPCIILSGLTEAQKKAYVIADNQLPLNADWDLDKLKLELDTLKELDFDIDVIGFDNDFLSDILGDKLLDEDYNTSVESPVYETSEEKPNLDELIDRTKTDELLDEIDKADIPDDVKGFLRLSAERHTIFKFDKIADYYPHASESIQSLMESSALIIIDFDKAIENGFINLTDNIKKQYGLDHNETGEPDE